MDAERSCIGLMMVIEKSVTDKIRGRLIQLRKKSGAVSQMMADHWIRLVRLDESIIFILLISRTPSELR